ncbi:lysophospholipid acyltransferase family protein [Noviherbaspirillum sp.]|uniref:lysophospholipid acyltransferase family protein n=1 Tax=Noviherbaspirillum sp. TaxID=1926288 RepID=UPI002FDFC0DF
MIAYRLLRIIVHLFAGMATCAFIFPRLDAAGRQDRIRRWAGKLLAICGVRVEVIGTLEASVVRRSLFVSNHVSWLDIFVIDSVLPCRFVAKSDIRGWPLVGWLCDKAGTVFIARGRVRDVRKIYEGLVASLQAGEHVAFFPEGTTAAQGSPLPFHANLFEAAVEAQVPIQPCAVRYLDDSGNYHPAADFVGDMTFVQSILAILKAGRIHAQLLLLPPMQVAPGMHRRELAGAAHKSITVALRIGGAQPVSTLEEAQISPGR